MQGDQPNAGNGKTVIALVGDVVQKMLDDRRGDVLFAKGDKDGARKAFEAAYKAMDDKLEYRRLIDAKLTALGAAPAPASGAAK